MSQAGSFWYRHYIIEREKSRIRDIFQRYLPPQIARRVLAVKDSDFLKGENRRVCILFSDIRDFTKYAETKSPEEVVRRLNEYLQSMSKVVTSQNGVVDKFLGDGLMAFFESSEGSRNPSHAGITAAQRMLRELDSLNATWKQQGEEAFKIAIGIHTGDVMIGNIGSNDKTEYTVIGDPVNLASRLLEKTKETNETVLVSESVYADIAERFEAEDKGIVDIKGHSPVRIYAIKLEG